MEKSPSTSRESGGADIVAADRFCWTCHFEGVDLSCHSCPRSFHKECVDLLKNSPNAIIRKTKKSADSDEVITKLLKCQECIIADKESLEPIARLKRSEKNALFSALCATWKEYWAKQKESTIMNVWYYKEDYEVYWDSVAKAMDLVTLCELVEQGQIKTMSALAGELKWIHHNSVNFNGATDQETQDTEAFQKSCFEQLNKVLGSCLDCELLLSSKPKDGPHKGDKFLELCSTPHIIAWVKVLGYPLWPSKIIHADPNYVEAIGFGDHMRVIVTLDKCLLFSNRQPEENKQKRYEKHMNKLEAAIVEAKKYLRAMAVSEFGPMRLDETATNQLQMLTPNFVLSIFPAVGDEIAERMAVQYIPYF